MSWKKFDDPDVLDSGKLTVMQYFIADEEADIQNLPGLDDVAFGSMCACLENGKRYILRESGDWTEQ